MSGSGGGSSSSSASVAAGPELSSKLVAPEWVAQLRRVHGKPKSIMQLVTSAEARAKDNYKLLDEIYDLGCQALGPLTVQDAQGGVNAQLCARRLEAMCRFDADEARMFFRFLRQQNIAQKDARVHLARADMEVKKGYGLQAAFTLQQGIALEAAPVEKLKAALQRLPGWVIRKAGEEALKESAASASAQGGSSSATATALLQAPNAVAGPAPSLATPAPESTAQELMPAPPSASAVAADAQQMQNCVAQGMVPEIRVTAAAEEAGATRRGSSDENRLEERKRSGSVDSSGSGAAETPVRPRTLSFAAAGGAKQQPAAAATAPHGLTVNRRSLDQRSSLARRVSTISQVSNLSPIVEADSVDQPSMSIDALSAVEGPSVDMEVLEDLPELASVYEEEEKLDALPHDGAERAQRAAIVQQPHQTGEQQHAVGDVSFEAATAEKNTALSSPKTYCVNGVAYRRICLLARGGASKVYKVSGPEGEVRALKRVDLEAAAQNDEESRGVQALQHEVTLLRKLSDRPNIIHMYDSETSATHIHIVMELGDMDLGRFLHQREHLTVGDVQALWRQMLEAVEVIHQERIVHRDLKPHNFMVVGGRLKLIDFNIAKQLNSDTTSLLREDHPVGTISYMAPEAFQCESKMGRQADVWSLGVLLYYVVYGRTPFASFPADQRRMNAIQDTSMIIDYPDEHKLKDCSEHTKALVTDVIQRCLQRDPLMRPSIQTLLGHEFLQNDSMRLERRSFDQAMQALVLGMCEAARAGMQQDACLGTQSTNADDAGGDRCEQSWQLVANEVWKLLSAEQHSVDDFNENAAFQSALKPFSQWIARGVCKRQRPQPEQAAVAQAPAAMERVRIAGRRPFDAAQSSSIFAAGNIIQDKSLKPLLCQWATATTGKENKAALLRHSDPAGVDIEGRRRQQEERRKSSDESRNASDESPPEMSQVTRWDHS